MRRLAIGRCLGGVLALAGLAQPLLAQSPAAAPGPYAEYPRPAACVSVARRVAVLQTWGEPFDTLPYDEARRVDPDARAAGAACLKIVVPAGPRVASAPPEDVPALFFLGRMLSEDTLADKAFHRFLSGERTLDDSIHVVWYGMHAYSSGLPRSLEVSARMAAWLDTLGAIGERPYLPDDSGWSSQHATPGWVATARLDTSAMRREIGLQRKNYASLPLTARGGTDGMLLSVQSQELLLELLQHPRADSLVRALKARAIELYGLNQERSLYGAGLGLLGEHFPELHPDFWFHRPGAGATLPRQGHITIVQYVDPSNGPYDNLAATVHRLKARFGDALDLVLLAQTHGHFNGRVQLEPAEEAAMLSRRVLEEWKGDATVGVYTTQFTALPAPDRRRRMQPIAELGQVMYGGGALIIDKRGILILADFLGLYTGSERALERLIQKLLEAQGE